ncbi:Uncharacterised protein [marine metagenome]
MRLRNSEKLVEKSVATKRPVAAPATVADIVCLSSITRAYIVHNKTGITITANHQLYRRITKYAVAPASVEWPEGVLCLLVDENGRWPSLVPMI